VMDTKRSATRKPVRLGRGPRQIDCEDSPPALPTRCGSDSLPTLDVPAVMARQRPGAYPCPQLRIGHRPTSRATRTPFSSATACSVATFPSLSDGPEARNAERARSTPPAARPAPGLFCRDPKSASGTRSGRRGVVGADEVGVPSPLR
jgi:hypothetical protein